MLADISIAKCAAHVAKCRLAQYIGMPAGTASLDAFSTYFLLSAAMRPDRAHDARVVAKSIAWVLVFIALSGVVTAQDDLTAAPSTIRDGETGVVLLQDGGVLEGR